MKDALEAAVDAFYGAGYSTKHDNMREAVRAYLDALDPAEVQQRPDVYIHTVDVEDIIKAVRP